MFRDWLRKIAKDKGLRGEDYRVLLILLASTESNSVEITQIEIAQSLEIKRTRVSRAIKRLTENGVIKKKLIAGKLVGYRFLIEE